MSAVTDAGDAQAGTFTAAPEGWSYRGALTFENAAAVFEATQALPLPESGRIDFAHLVQADSAALAIVIELLRRGHSEGKTVIIDNLPASLASLARVYGVEDILRPTV